MEGNRIKHSTTSPYHPSSNGLTERVIQVIKQALRSGKGGNVQEILSKFLFMYHITPHTTTGVPPSELLMGCCLRSRLDLCFPEVEETVLKAQNNQKRYHDSSKQLQVFSVGDKVLVKNFRSSSPKWLSGTVVRQVIIRILSSYKMVRQLGDTLIMLEYKRLLIQR